MFFSIVKWVIISFSLIFLMHHLYMFLMNTLTVPKIKDLVNKPNQQYKDIFDSLQHTQAPATSLTAGKAPAQSQDPMADELTSFLNDLKKTNTTTKNEIGDINSFKDIGMLGNPTDIGYSLY
jgi:hypothetical protein